MNIGTAHPVFGLTPEDPNDRVHVLRIPDGEGSAYDTYLLAPAEMTDPVAFVNEAIRDVVVQNPDEYTWEELWEVLEPAGIRIAQIQDTIQF